MSSTAILDSNLIAWDQNQFDSNPYHFRQLAEIFGNIVGFVKSSKCKILMTDTMIDYLMNQFPCVAVKTSLPELSDVIRLVFSFLTSEHMWNEYTDFAELSTTIRPNPLQSTNDVKHSTAVEQVFGLAALNNIEHLLTHSVLWPEPTIFQVTVSSESSIILALRDSVEWESVNDPLPRYEASPKHNPTYGWGSKTLLPDDIMQSLLETAIAVDSEKTVRYGMHSSVIYEFRSDNAGAHHAYPVPYREVPTYVLRHFRTLGLLKPSNIKRTMKKKQH